MGKPKLHGLFETAFESYPSCVNTICSVTADFVLIVCFIKSAFASIASFQAMGCDSLNACLLGCRLVCLCEKFVATEIHQSDCRRAPLLGQ